MEFFESGFGIIVGKAIAIVLIIAFSWLFIKISKRLTARLVLRSRNNDRPRVGTALTILQSAVRYVIYFIAFAAIVGQFGVNVAPIIASAGVVGVAVAFGAQSLVKDVITGLFIMVEDSYSVGDYITAAGVSGFVTEVGLRSTKIRDWTNETHIIPNGSITVISNYSKDPMTRYLDIPVAYTESVDKVRESLQDVIEKIDLEHKDIIKDLKICGLNEFQENRMVFKLGFSCDVENYSMLERAIRFACKNAFDEAGILMPACYDIFTEKKAEYERA